MFLSVIICTYNREKYIGNLLKSIANNGLSPKLYEILLIDNNCTDNTPSICSGFNNNNPQINFRYYTEYEQGLSAARNRGIHEAKGDILVYIDDDAIIDTWYLQTIYNYLSSHPNISAVGGPILPIYETQEPKWMTRFTKELLTGYLYFGNSIRTFPGERFPGGGNVAYRANVFKQVGLFNTSLGRKGDSLMGAEEKDIFDKMRTIGLEYMYLPQMILHHIIPQSKLEKNYFDRLTYQIGVSEKKRTLSLSPQKYIHRIIEELIKWIATLMLFAFYFALFQPNKGWKLIQFRFNISKGLLLG